MNLNILVGMRKLALILIILCFWMQNCAFSQELRELCKECMLDLNVEGEIEDMLQIKSTYISLDECLDIALENNFKIKSVQKLFESSKYEYQNSLAKVFLPEVGLNANVKFLQGQILVGGVLSDYLAEDAFSFWGFISHDLTKGGKYIFESRARNDLKKARNHNLDFTQDEILLRTSQSYYALLNSKLNIEIYVKNHNERKAQLKLTQNLAEVGLGTKFDVTRSESELAQAKQSLLTSLYEFRLNQAKLANIMGIEITTTLMPIETKPELRQLVDDEESVETLYESALEWRDDIKKFRKEIDALRDYKAATYTEFVPRADVRAQQAWQGTKAAGIGPNTIITFNVDVPIGSNLGVGTMTKVKAQQAEIKAKEFELIQMQRNIKEELVDALAKTRVSKERYKIAIQQVEYATEAARLSELRLDAGEGILIDVIQAQAFKTQTRIELLRAIIQYDISQIELLFGAGTISPANILKGYTP